MILERQNDFTLIGKNYISYLFSIHLMSKNQNVLIIDDPRVRIGNNYLEKISELDKRTLMSWGQLYDIDCLKKINDYVSPYKETWVFDEFIFRSGNSSFENLQELSRKLPEVFSLINLTPQRFNSLINVMIRKTVEYLFFLDSHKDVKLKEVLTLIPNELRPLWENFLLKFNLSFDQSTSEELFKFKQLINSSIGRYQNKTSMKYNELEIFHLFLNLFSPHYKLNQEKIIPFLHEHYLRCGGQIKKTQVESWQIYRSRPWSIQLGSFDGIIFPGHIFYFGQIHHEIPFRVSSEHQVLNSFSMIIDGDFSFFEVGEIFYHSSALEIGGPIPFWFTEIIGENKVKAVFYFRKLPGTKPSFYYKTAYQEFISKFFKAYSNLAENDEDIEDIEDIEVINEGDELLEIDNSSSLNRSQLYLNKCVLQEHTSPLETKILQGLHYNGPIKGHQLGLFSFLSEIKYTKDYADLF